MLALMQKPVPWSLEPHTCDKLAVARRACSADVEMVQVLWHFTGPIHTRRVGSKETLISSILDWTRVWCCSDLTRRGHSSEDQPGIRRALGYILQTHEKHVCGQCPSRDAGSCPVLTLILSCCAAAPGVCLIACCW